MKFTVVTILPELIEPSLVAGVVGRAREAGTITVDTVNPRDFTHDKHRTVDDTPYGGGPGMVMKPEPLLAAIDRACAGSAAPRRILLSPSGTPLTQARVRELAALDHLVLVCGRYEGVDQRVIDAAIDEEVSIGDYVLSGGELGALVVIDAVARLVPGVLGAADSADDESFSAGLLEYPQYTRPADLAPSAIDSARTFERGVPTVLTSGNHAAIATWRRNQAMARTAVRRPDMWRRFRPAPADAKRIAAGGVPLLPLASRTAIALVHHPVVDRTGAVVTTALTNFDVHDLARSAMTYGLRAVYIVTPITSQRDKADHIAAVWAADDHGEHRSRALALVRSVASIEDAIAAHRADLGVVPNATPAPGAADRSDVAARAPADIATADGDIATLTPSADRNAVANGTMLGATDRDDLDEPIVVATSARSDSFPAAQRRAPDALVSEATAAQRSLLILVGTGWGLAESLIPSVSRVLTPIEGASEWNHLSVRSATAVILDRLFGRQP